MYKSMHAVTERTGAMQMYRRGHWRGGKSVPQKLNNEKKTLMVTTLHKPHQLALKLLLCHCLNLSIEEKRQKPYYQTSGHT